MKTSFKLCLSLSIVSLALASGCQKSKIQNSVNREPSLPSQPYAYNAVSDEIATLGRVLFYEVQLSANNTVSCGTCHIQALGFSDGKQFSAGLADRHTSRNTPGITSESQNFGLFWDSRASDFEDLVLRPVTNHTEMGILDINTIPDKLKNLPYYSKLFDEAFGSSEITVDKIRQSMAAFLSALTRPQHSKFEQGRSSSNSNLNAMELMGMEIFTNKGKCSQCHTLSSFGWGDAANIGLELDYTDKGMGAIENADGTINEFAEGMFRIPSLFNIELTAPYMHDGRFRTLEDVVEHYNSGIKNHKNLDWRLRDFTNNGSGNPQSLGLNDMEKKSLVAFLKTLTDWDYVNDPRFNNPFIH